MIKQKLCRTTFMATNKKENHLKQVLGPEAEAVIKTGYLYLYLSKEQQFEKLQL